MISISVGLYLCYSGSPCPASSSQKNLCISLWVSKVQGMSSKWCSVCCPLSIVWQVFWCAFWTANRLSVEDFGCYYLRCVHEIDKLEGFSLALSLEFFLNVFDSTKNPREQTWLITIDWQISWFVWVFAGSKLLSIQCAPISYSGLVTFILNNALI